MSHRRSHATSSPDALPLSAVEVLVEALPTPISWEALFGNNYPVEVDVGCGKGRFLIEAAGSDPARNYLGVELAGKPYFAARDRMAKRGLVNARVVRADARAFVVERVAVASVSAYHVLFPDPWPKKRHHKRRVVTPTFVEEMARTLTRPGVLHIATDIADYFEELAWIVESTGRFRLLEEAVFDADADLMTNFASKYIAEGRTLYRARFGLDSTRNGALPDALEVS